eukprot:CAMPEP_0168314330 /NCGR_PEP_ID=MMETSP0210-20121227/7213_1 /TAXON_ID=40633 /ORGANISM="Condylostoma magnum, Strain COL2" /LENGTH=61 /DNA_ID=CAMNT_0008280539 /DNA_START=795 /DNA_END=977 /DNA_ORIENTATION=+
MSYAYLYTAEIVPDINKFYDNGDFNSVLDLIYINRGNELVKLMALEHLEKAAGVIHDEFMS